MGVGAEEDLGVKVSSYLGEYVYSDYVFASELLSWIMILRGGHW